MQQSIKFNFHFIVISIAAGIIIGWYMLPQDQEQTSSADGGNKLISVSANQSNSGAQQGSESASSILGSAVIGPKKGDTDQGLQAAPKSVDELVGNGEIIVK